MKPFFIQTFFSSFNIPNCLILPFALFKSNINIQNAVKNPFPIASIRISHVDL